MTAAPSDPIHTSKQIYSDWLNQVGDKNETEVFDKLPQQRKDVVRTAVSILSNYQKGVTESQILPEEISILGRSKSPAGETTLPDEALFARVNQSFQTIHPLGKAEDILRAKYIPSSNLKEQVEELKEGSLEKFQAMTEAIPRIVEKQGKIGERILSMREDYILAPLREWTAALPNPRDKAIAEKAILRLEEKLLPAHYGVTKANIEEGFSLFETEYHLARSQSLKTDVKTIQTTGLAARSSAPTTASGVQDLENALTRLQEQRANLLTDLHKGLTEGFTGSEEGEFASYLNEYRQEADALINRALGLERELEPHLANPEMAARYCFVCSTHAKLIQQHQNLALAMEEIPKNSVDFARRYNRSYNSSLSILGSLWKATKTTSVPEAIVQNESVARGLIEKTIIWGEFAKDNGSGKAALELARYYSSYAPINGEGNPSCSKRSRMLTSPSK